MMEGEAKKLCRGKCRLVKPVSEYYKHPTNKDGLQGKCIVCQKEYQEEYNLRHRRQIRKYKKGYYERNKVRLNEYYNRDWYPKNKDVRLQKLRDKRAKYMRFD